MFRFSLDLMNRLNTTESAVFIYCHFSLFLKDPFFQIILCTNPAPQFYPVNTQHNHEFLISLENKCCVLWRGRIRLLPRNFTVLN